MAISTTLLVLGALVAPSHAPAPAPATALEAPAAPSSWLVVPSVDRRGRRPFRPDAVFARHLLDRASPPPKAGDTITGDRGEERTWDEREPDAEGWVGGEVGWAYGTVETRSAQVVLARLRGAWELYVNGAEFIGDAYSYGFGGVPIALEAGVNQLYVTGVRGRFQLELVPVDGKVVIGTWDVTAPNPVRSSDPQEGGGVTEEIRFAVPFFSATQDSLAALHLKVSDDEQSSLEHAPRLLPLALAKPFFEHDLGARVNRHYDELPIEIVVQGDDGPEATATIKLVTKDPDAVHKRVYESFVDGALQEYAVVPPTDGLDPDKAGIVLSLHGAGVGAQGQAACYARKSQLWILAPTNRRPFGFDWQDWGRRDAYEALDALVRFQKASPKRVFVTGHSMGGHGAWHLAANDPDRFMAVAPSAGWRSFDTYGGRPEGELAELWHAADGASRTEALIGNLRQVPAYVLHGEADDNVPASEGHAMVALLEEAGAKPRSHFEEGKGHWWDGDASAGTDCVDWPGIFELFDSRRLRKLSPRTVSFTTVHPGVDSQHHWVRVDQPLVWGSPSTIHARWDREIKGIVVETDNVRRFHIDGYGGRPVIVDGTELEHSGGAPINGFEHGADGWQPAETELKLGWDKKPISCGPFKRAFDRRFVLVYGTLGPIAEAREHFERARADQQEWWYRANGAPRLLADREVENQSLRGFLEARNLILYGNADSNDAWARLVPEECPIRVRAGRIEVGDRAFEGTDIGCVFAYPRNDLRKRGNLVGVIGSTGPTATRLGYTLPYFVSGVGYPDWVVFDASILTEGDGGVLAAGWFDGTWQIQDGAFFRERDE